jgi:hypothetical protein
MGKTAASIAVIAILGVVALAAVRYAAQAAKPMPVADAEGKDMLGIQTKPAVKLDETPRSSAGQPVRLETATFALG